MYQKLKISYAHTLILSFSSQGFQNVQKIENQCINARLWVIRVSNAEKFLLKNSTLLTMHHLAKTSEIINEKDSDLKKKKRKKNLCCFSCTPPNF